MPIEYFSSEDSDMMNQQERYVVESGNWKTRFRRKWVTTVAAQYEVTHQCPPKRSGVMPCCGRTPFEVPRTDRMTVDLSLVTCQPCNPLVESVRDDT